MFVCRTINGYHRRPIDFIATDTIGESMFEWSWRGRKSFRSEENRIQKFLEDDDTVIMTIDLVHSFSFFCFSLQHKLNRRFQLINKAKVITLLLENVQGNSSVCIVAIEWNDPRNFSSREKEKRKDLWCFFSFHGLKWANESDLSFTDEDQPIERKHNGKSLHFESIKDFWDRFSHRSSSFSFSSLSVVPQDHFTVTQVKWFEKRACSFEKDWIDYSHGNRFGQINLLRRIFFS